MSKASILVRMIKEPEANPGETPPGDMYEANLPGADWQESPQYAQAQAVSSDRFPEESIPTTFTNQASSTTDLEHDDPARSLLRESAFAFLPRENGGVTANNISAVAAGNKLVRAGGWPDIGLGDDVLISGLPGDPGVPGLFRAKVLGVQGDELSLNPADINLVDAAAAGDVSVVFAKQYRLGSYIPTLTIEDFNLETEKGKVTRRVGVSQWSLSVQYPNPAQEQFGLIATTQAEDRTALLANNTVDLVPGAKIKAGNDFQDALFPSSGFGLRYIKDGVETLLDEVHLQQLSIQITNPLEGRGGIGLGFGPQSLKENGEFQIQVSMRFERAVYKDDVQTDFIADQARRTEVCGYGIGYRDSDGNRGFFRLPRLTPTGRAIEGKARNGAQMCTVNYTGAKEPQRLHTPFQWTLFNPVTGF